MSIKKGARAYYADTDYKRDGTEAMANAIDAMPTIPTPEESDAGKVIKVASDGTYGLSEDEHTTVIANPDTESTERLDKLTVGNTTYLVNEDVLPTVIKAVRFKINTIHGSDAHVCVKRLRMKNTINGDYYQYGGSDTCTCSTEDNVNILIDNGTFGETMIDSTKLPFYVNVNFADGIDTTQFNEFGIICAAYENASPLSIELFVSADGDNFISVAQTSNLSFVYEGYVSVYQFGDVVLRIPDYTSADRGKFLGINNNDHIVWGNMPLFEDVIFAPTTPLLPNSSKVIDFDINNLDNYKFAAVYHRLPNDTNQMSCWFVPISYIKYCLDNNLYMVLTGFDDRYILFTFSTVDNVTSIITSNGSNDAIYKIILYK